MARSDAGTWQVPRLQPGRTVPPGRRWVVAESIQHHAAHAQQAEEEPATKARSEQHQVVQWAGEQEQAVAQEEEGAEAQRPWGKRLAHWAGAAPEWEREEKPGRAGRVPKRQLHRSEEETGEEARAPHQPRPSTQPTQAAPQEHVAAGCGPGSPVIAKKELSDAPRAMAPTSSSRSGRGAQHQPGS